MSRRKRTKDENAFYIALGERLKILRTKIKKVKPSDVALDNGISIDHYRKMEKGESGISAWEIHELCRYLDTSPNTLYNINSPVKSDMSIKVVEIFNKMDAAQRKTWVEMGKILLNTNKKS